jgi:hypothetical protein
MYGISVVFACFAHVTSLSSACVVPGMLMSQELVECMDSQGQQGRCPPTPGGALDSSQGRHRDHHLEAAGGWNPRVQCALCDVCWSAGPL